MLARDEGMNPNDIPSFPGNRSVKHRHSCWTCCAWSQRSQGKSFGKGELGKGEPGKGEPELTGGPEMTWELHVFAVVLATLNHPNDSFKSLKWRYPCTINNSYQSYSKLTRPNNYFPSIPIFHAIIPSTLLPVLPPPSPLLKLQGPVEKAKAAVEVANIDLRTCMRYLEVQTSWQPCR